MLMPQRRTKMINFSNKGFEDKSKKFFLQNEFQQI